MEAVPRASRVVQCQGKRQSLRPSEGHAGRTTHAAQSIHVRGADAPPLSWVLGLVDRPREACHSRQLPQEPGEPRLQSLGWAAKSRRSPRSMRAADSSEMASPLPSTGSPCLATWAASSTPLRTMAGGSHGTSSNERRQERARTRESLAPLLGVRCSNSVVLT